MTKHAQNRRKRFGRRNFKQRYFRLTTQSLSYSKAKGKRPICDIPLTDLVAVEKLEERSFKMQNIFRVSSMSTTTVVRFTSHIPYIFLHPTKAANIRQICTLFRHVFVSTTYTLKALRKSLKSDAFTFYTLSDTLANPSKSIIQIFSTHPLLRHAVFRNSNLCVCWEHLIKVVFQSRWQIEPFSSQ